MKAIGFDLGTNTGYATLIDGVLTSGVMNFSSKRFEGGGMRFLRFRKAIEEMFDTVQPEVVYFEEVRRHMGVDAAHIYGGLMAQLTASCEERSIPYSGIPVGTVKKFATGKGNANKDKMIEAAKEQFPDQNIKDDNQADAIFILYCGIN
jgi:crossover junction endodeoxyribonuclease RuvC